MPDTTKLRPLRAARPRYRATVTVTYPTDPAVRAQRAAGENVPVARWTKIKPGHLVPDEIVEASPWLIRQGHVEAVADAAPSLTGGGGS